MTRRAVIPPPFADSTRGLSANNREYRDAGRDGGGRDRAARQRWRRDPGVDFALYRGSEECQLHWLNGQPFDNDLSQRLNREVRLANDANCLAVSEAVDGAAAGAQTVFAVIIGTGCGAGVAIQGRSHIGGNGTAGEWGHNPLPWMDDDELRYRAEVPCYCGKQGCIETFISGTGFATDYQRLSGQSLTGNAIMQRVSEQDPLAEQALKRYEMRLAKSLAHVVNILDPDVIVLGGGMSNVERLYQTVPELVKSWVFGGECETPIRKAVHGDSSGVRGAARLWPL